MAELDHLVVSAVTLEAGVDHVRDRLGLPMRPGGRHVFMGTHNALMSLGPSAYLEVIAIDPDLPAPDWPRWFGLDRFSGPARLTNWVVRTADLAGALARAPQGAGRIMAAARGDLRWQMAVPDGGQYPFEGGFPGLISWRSVGHPCDRLPDIGVRLEMLEIGSDNAVELAGYVGSMCEMDKIEIRPAERTVLTARLSGPAGPVRLT